MVGKPSTNKSLGMLYILFVLSPWQAMIGRFTQSDDNWEIYIHLLSLYPTIESSSQVPRFRLQNIWFPNKSPLNPPGFLGFRSQGPASRGPGRQRAAAVELSQSALQLQRQAELWDRTLWSVAWRWRMAGLRRKRYDWIILDTCKM